MQINAQNSLILSELSIFTEKYDLKCEIYGDQNKLWWGRKIRDTTFSWVSYLNRISPHTLVQMMSEVGKNLKNFEKTLSTTKERVNFYTKQQNLTVQLKYAEKKAVVVSINIFQHSRSFKYCLDALENHAKYLEHFSKNDHTLKILNNPTDITFKNLFSKIIEYGQEKYRFKIGNTKIFVSRDLKEISIVLKELGRGSMNRIYEVFDLLKKEHRVIRKTCPQEKMSKPQNLIKQYEELVSKILSGCNILRELNKNGPLRGIPSAPTQTTLFIEKKGVLKSFVSVDLASCDLFEAVFKYNYLSKIELKKQLCLLKDLVEVVFHIHKAGIIHGDIKPENIGVDVDENGLPIRLYIIDWDGATKNPNKNPPAYTSDYFPSTIYENQNFTLSEIKRCDVFALSLTFLEVVLAKTLTLEKEILNDMEFPRFFDKHIMPKKLLKNLKETALMDRNGMRNSNGNTLPKKIILLLLKGMTSNAPSIDLFFKKYTNVLQGL